MKKSLKIIFIIIGVLLTIILLDTVQALVLNNNPLIAIKTKCRSTKGLFVTTYHCNNGSNITKFNNFSCNINNICNNELENIEHIHKIIDSKLEEYEKNNGKKYPNVSATSANQNLNKVVITLVDNSEEKQKMFRKDIYDSPYIIFEEGGPYTTLVDKVSLKVKADTLTPKGAIFILKNATDNKYWYGPEYIIEKKDNGGWQEIATLSGNPLVWNAIAYPLNAREEIEINIDWSYGYGKLNDGEYRLVKSTFKEEVRPIDETKKLYLYAEFIVK